MFKLESNLVQGLIKLGSSFNQAYFQLGLTSNVTLIGVKAPITIYRVTETIFPKRNGHKSEMVYFDPLLVKPNYTISVQFTKKLFTFLAGCLQKNGKKYIIVKRILALPT